MALTLDASTPAQVTGSSGTTATTASFTAPANALLVAFYSFDNGATGINLTAAISDSGGLTWSLVGRRSVGTNTPAGTGTDGGVYIFAATTTSATARTVTATLSSSHAHALSVKVFTDTGGAPTIGAVAGFSTVSGLPSCSITTTAANSWVWSVSSDWTQRGPGTPGSGQIMVDEYDPAGLYTSHLWKQSSTTASSGTSVTMNLTAPSGQQVNQLAVEIKPNSGVVTKQGSASGTVAWAGAASGSRTSSGNHPGSIAWAGSASGATTHSGSRTGAVLWTGSAHGVAPANSGSTAGTLAWTGSASGSTLHSGSASGALQWAGSATGSASHSGNAAGSLSWTGSASGSAPAAGGPPAVTNLTSGNSAQGTASVTTASISPSGIVLLAINSYISTGSVQPPDPTVSGLGMTWTKLGSVATDTAGTDQSTMWLYAGTGTATPGSVTMTFASSPPRLNYLVYDVTGSTATGFPVQTATSAANPASGTSISGSYTSAITSGNLGFAFIGVEASTPTFTPGSGWTALDTNEVQAFSAAFAQTTTSGSSVAASWSTAGKAGYIAIEIPAGVHTQGGSASGGVSWVGSATGAVTHAGSATGSVAWSGSATGSVQHSGSVSGSVSWTGHATGSQPTVAHSGSVAGHVSWSGAANGSTAHDGLVSAALSWVGSASGTTQHSAHVSGAIQWVGHATGLATHQGSASGAIGWAGQATGAFPGNEGSVIGQIFWTGSATGATPYMFSPPFVQEFATDEPVIFRKMRLGYSVTVLKNGPSYRTVRRPSPEEIAAADIAYLGGHVYTISNEEAAALVAAGYEVTR